MLTDPVKTLPKLGCKRPVVSPDMPQLHTLKSLLRKPAPSIVRKVDPNAQMYMNDSVGDCSSAGIANLLNAYSALCGYKLSITAEQVLEFYSLSTGYVIGDPTTDNGAVLTSVLQFAALNGYAITNEILYPIWGTADISDPHVVALIVESFGACYIGVGLAEADQDTSVVWDVTTPGNQTPWSWGGHCLIVYGYESLAEDGIVDLVTWGGIQKCTWRWLRSRMCEAHAVAFRQVMPASGHTFTGEDWDTLVAENKRYLQQGIAG